ncbi:MAG: hypothetical protein H6R10_738 [Rhodocyclaceae bacterium]|nr:hypothetical protein [Rhodocyclaceae bacterium]
MAGYKLSAALLNRKKAPGKVTDGMALSFIRNKDGSLTAWQRVKRSGKDADIKVASLAGEVTADWLQDVRSKAYAIKTSGDSSSGAMTFQGAWEKFYKAITGAENSKWSPRTAKQAEARVLNWLSPTGLWSMPLTEIRSGDIEAALADAKARLPKMAPKLLALIARVISYAAHDLDLDANAAKTLRDRWKATEKPVKMDKLPAITDWAGLGRLLNAIEHSSLYLTTRIALLLQAYTAQRSGEVAGARWDEFVFHDDGTATWTIPRSRMKVSDWNAKPYHQVIKLPAEAANLVRRLPKTTDFLFVPRHGEADCITVEAFSMSFQRLGFRGVAVPHGWRSALKTLANDAADSDGRPLFSQRWVEDVLDHTVRGVEGHYTRAQAEQGMARVLTWWAKELDKSKGTSLRQKCAAA